MSDTWDADGVTMPYSVCSTPGCPEVHAGKGRCPSCAHAYEVARGSRHERGYGTAHYRDGDAAIAGATHCALCLVPFTPDNPAQRGHAKAVRDGGTGADGYVAQCRRCNLGWRKTGA